MKTNYRVSRIIIVFLTAIVSYIILINEDISFKIVCIPVFSMLTFVASWIGTPVSKKMICVGDGIVNNILRIIYYVLLLIAIIAVFLGVVLLSTHWNGHVEMSPDASFASQLGRAICFVLTLACVFVLLVAPYVQTLIVLFLRKIQGKKDNK